MQQPSISPFLPGLTDSGIIRDSSQTSGSEHKTCDNRHDGLPLRNHHHDLPPSHRCCPFLRTDLSVTALIGLSARLVVGFLDIHLERQHDKIIEKVQYGTIEASKAPYSGENKRLNCQSLGFFAIVAVYWAGCGGLNEGGNYAKRVKKGRTIKSS